MINNKLIHFNKRETFDTELANGNIPDTSIVFIKDTQLIYTHGQIYDASEFVLPEATKANLGGIKLGDRLDVEGTKVIATSLNSSLNKYSNILSLYLGVNYDDLEVYIILGKYDPSSVKMPEQYVYGSFIIDRGNTEAHSIKALIDVSYGCVYSSRSLNYRVLGSWVDRDFETMISGTYKVTIDNTVYLAIQTKKLSVANFSFVGVYSEAPFIKSQSQIDSAEPLNLYLEPSMRKRIENSILEKVTAGLPLENVLAYGVEWDTTVADPHLTRIGNMSLHKTLPILSLIKGCIAQGNKLMYWLDEDDWKYKKGGNPDKGETELLARLDGYDGTVRIYIPEFYIKSESIGTKRRVWISTIRIDNTWTHQPELLVDAYRCTLLNTVPTDMGYLSTLPVNSAISVVNTNSYCRGSSNNATYDKYLETDPFRSLLGKPRTYIPRANARTYSRNASSELLSYEQYKNIFYWLYVVEYANFNCLEAYNPELTAEGYRQGGMGPGVTNWTDTNWNNYNGYYPLTPCGYTNEFGNKTGVKSFTTVAGTNNLDAGTAAIPAITSVVPRWRGFENPFGDIWTNLDGILIDTPLAGASDTSILPTCYIITDPEKYTDSLTDIESKADRVYKQPHSSGYVKEWHLGDTADMVPESIGGNTTQYKCDYYWVNYDDTPETLLVGGYAYRGSLAGLGGFSSTYAVSNSWTPVGFRSVSSFSLFFSLNE